MKQNVRNFEKYLEWHDTIRNYTYKDVGKMNFIETKKRSMYVEIMKSNDIS